MLINESALRQYVVGYRAAKPAVLWLNIHDFKEVVGKESTTVSFVEAGETYNYIGSATTGYKEIKNKAPFITSYELLDEAEIEKRGYIQQFTDVLDTDDEEVEEDDEEWYNPDDYDSDAWRRNCGGGIGCGGGYHRHYGCGGGYSSCGGGC